MNNIEKLNLSMNDELELEAMVEEISAREEFACTLDGCAGNVCGVN